MPFDAKSFRRALGHFATGVTVVTLWNDGEVHGMTANAFTSVSLDPPLILVCVDKRNTTHRLIEKVGRFAVNFLADEHESVSRYFAGERDLTPSISYDSESARSPILEGVLAWLDCQVWRSYDGGDHTIFVGLVQELDAPGGKPLLFYQGAYDRLA